MVADDDILSMPVTPGSVRYGAAYSEQATGDLLVDAATWQRMVDQQHRLLSTLDRWIELLERAHEDRTAAGIKAGENVREQADRTLIAWLGRFHLPLCMLIMFMLLAGRPAAALPRVSSSPSAPP